MKIGAFTLAEKIRKIIEDDALYDGRKINRQFWGIRLSQRFAAGNPDFPGRYCSKAGQRKGSESGRISITISDNGKNDGRGVAVETRQLKILVIDDNQDNVIVLKALIQDTFPEASGVDDF